MIVVSLDPATRTVSMLSIPRDMVDVPMPDGRQYRDKINSLVSYARHHPAQFPGSDGTGFDVLMGALGTLLNTQIDYYAKVDLGGFVRVVDVLGGVDVNVARAFCDPSYDEYGFTRGFSITAGRHHLNGQQALAYARVRKASGESDFTRAARQQEVISGIRDSIVHGRVPQRPDRAAPGDRQDGRDQHPARHAARSRRARHRDRPRADLSSGGQPPARELGLRRPRLHPDPGHRGDPGACRQALPGRRPASGHGLRPAQAVDRRGRRERRRRLCAGAQAEADAHPEAQADAIRRAVRVAERTRGEPNPRREPARRTDLVGRGPAAARAAGRALIGPLRNAWAACPAWVEHARVTRQIRRPPRRAVATRYPSRPDPARQR